MAVQEVTSNTISKDGGGETVVQDYRIADISLAEFGRKEIDLAEEEMQNVGYVKKP